MGGKSLLFILVILVAGGITGYPAHAVPIAGDDELNPLPGVEIALGTFEWVDFPDALGVHPDTVELGTWAEIPLGPVAPGVESFVVDIFVDEGSTIDGVGFPSADVFDAPGGFVVHIADQILELSKGEFGLLPSMQVIDMSFDVTVTDADGDTLFMPLYLATTGTTLTITVTPVPEPTALTLAALAMLGLVAFGWRRRGWHR